MLKHFLKVYFKTLLILILLTSNILPVILWGFYSWPAKILLLYFITLPPTMGFIEIFY